MTAILTHFRENKKRNPFSRLVFLPLLLSFHAHTVVVLSASGTPSDCRFEHSVCVFFPRESQARQFARKRPLNSLRSIQRDIYTFRKVSTRPKRAHSSS